MTLRALFVAATLAFAPAFSGPVAAEAPSAVKLTPTSLVFDLEGTVLLVDPVGDQEPYFRYGRPDIVVLTGRDPSRLSIDTMIGLLRRDTVVLASQDVIDALPLMISNNARAPFDPWTRQTVRGITFEAVPGDISLPAGAASYPRDAGSIRVKMIVGGAEVFF